MDRCCILDCTLRDGGYITNWYFGENAIRNIIKALSLANLDYIECGYLNPLETIKGRTFFHDIEEIGNYFPNISKKPFMLAMADCAQILPKQITPYTGKSIAGIRVVFYKHQIREALELCRSVKEQGYQLFVQPMVTIDYSYREYGELISKIRALHPYAVSIVDSFGYMDKKDFRDYFQLLDEELDQEAAIGFHSHNNMQLAFTTAQDVLDYRTKRKLIIDASLLGMGRGAGNLNTELITNYYNRLSIHKYNMPEIMEIISSEIMPLTRKHTWGYSPYLFLTGLYHCHPNFACYLLENHEVTVADFEEFIKFIPQNMLTKCRRPYVEKLYKEFKENRKETDYVDNANKNLQ